MLQIKACGEGSLDSNLALYSAAQEGNLVKFNEAVEAGAAIENKNSEKI